MLCKSCGKENSEGAVICSGCGYNLSGVAVENNITNSGVNVASAQNIASQGKRFIHLILDYICFYVLMLILGIILGITGLYDLLGVEKWNDTIFGVASFFLFYFIFEVSWSKTPAKFITKTRVVMADNVTKPNAKVIAIRTLCRFIPFEAFSFLSKNPVGWHDKISETRVISEK